MTWLYDHDGFGSLVANEIDKNSMATESSSPASRKQLDNVQHKDKKKHQEESDADSDDEWFKENLIEAKSSVPTEDSLSKAHSYSSLFGPSGKNRRKVPFRIYFCSRTHSQLSQCVGELKKIKNLPRTFRSIVLGSRKNYCIASDVIRKGSVQAMNEACLNMQRNGNIEITLIAILNIM